MKNTRALLAIPLIAIAAIAIGVGMSSNVVAQPTTPTTVDQKEGPNDVADNAKEGPNGDGDGAQKDSTELKK